MRLVSLELAAAEIGPKAVQNVANHCCWKALGERRVAMSRETMSLAAVTAAKAEDSDRIKSGRRKERILGRKDVIGLVGEEGRKNGRVWF